MIILLLPTSVNPIKKTCLDWKSLRLTTTTTTLTAGATAVSMEQRLIPAIASTRSLSVIRMTIGASGVARVTRKSYLQQHTAQIVFVLMCPVHQYDKIMNKVYTGELKSSPPLNDLQQRMIQDSMDPEVDKGTILSPRSRPELSKFSRKVYQALGCTTTNVFCESPECRVHQARRPSPTKPLYGGLLASHNVIPVIEPPKLPHQDRNLYKV